MKMRNGLGKTAFYIISSEKCIRLNIPGTKEHAERKQVSRSWVGPDLLLHDPEIANNLKSPMLNDPEVWLLGENPKRLYGDTITNVRTLLFVTLENWKWPKCTSTREWMKKLGLSNNKSDKKKFSSPKWNRTTLATWVVHEISALSQKQFTEGKKAASRRQLHRKLKRRTVQPHIHGYTHLTWEWNHMWDDACLRQDAAS